MALIRQAFLKDIFNILIRRGQVHATVIEPCEKFALDEPYFH